MRWLVLVTCFLCLSTPALAGEPEARELSDRALKEAAASGSITKGQLLRLRMRRHEPRIEALDPEQRSEGSDQEVPSSSSSSSSSSSRR